MIDLAEYEECNYSQFGQDGVIRKLAEIFDPPKFFVEFGSSGRDDSRGNTPNLRRLGWKGVLIDCDEPKAKAIYPVIVRKISASNVDKVIGAAVKGKDVGFLSIDIDGQDYWVWKALTVISPPIVSIEFNPYLPPDSRLSVPLDDDFTLTRGDKSNFHGASMGAMFDLGKSKGYVLVAVCTVDMIFVREDVVGLVKFAGANDIATLYARPHLRASIPVRNRIEKLPWVNV